MKKGHRKHTRILLEIEAQIRFPDGKTFNGATKNISFGGCYFNCNELVGQRKKGSCLVELIPHADASGIAISIKSTILRLDGDGAGIKFHSIDIHDYHHFRNIMTYNSPDPNAIMDELEKNPGLIVD